MDKNLEWIRPTSYKAHAILLDGLTGTGKTMLMGLLDTFENVSIPRFDYQLEQICIAIDAHQITADAGLTLLQLLLDQRVYDLSISREVNLRPQDLSSVLRSSKRITYLKKLLLKQGPQHQDGLQDNEEKYLFIVHQLLDTSNVLMKLDGKKFKRILAVRHPFYLFDHWSSYVEMHGASPRDFTVMICKEQPVPWFITKNQDLYYAHSTEEKASIAIVELMAKQREYIRNNADILVIDFEKFVLSPKSYVNRISNLIGESQNSRLNLYMRQSKLPRSHINSSKRMEIYSRYGADLLDNSLTHKADYSKLRSRIKNKVSNKHFELMESVAHDYENDFGLWF